MFGVSCCPCITPAQGKDKSIIQAEFVEGIDPLIAGHRGQVAVMILHRESGAEFVYRADEPMPTASLIKFPVMVAAYQQAAQGQLNLQKMVTFRDADRVPGSGLLSTQFSDGLQLSVRDAIRLMMAFSDNAATNLVLKEMGLNATNTCIAQWNCPNTRIHACVFHPETSISPADSQRFGLGKTTARDMVQLLVQLDSGVLVDEPTCRTMRDHLLACDDQSRLTSLLPEGTKAAMKTGSTSSVRTVAGLLTSPGGTIVICVLTAENKDRRWSEDNDAHKLCAEIARVAWKSVNPDIFEVVEMTDGRLKLGSQGELVSDLQRSLNAKLPVTQQITVDGEFGPQTEQAVRSFQQQSHLPETGVTDAATWAALGPLIPEAPTPGQVLDQSTTDRQPADDVDGPPILSCRSWIIGNAKDGQIFAEHDAESPRDFASTTKIMTAYVVLQRAQTEPDLLKEMVTVSALADSTPGSTAHLRVGETLPMSELLRGLMLPSGNDAAVAIAEHLGRRLSSQPNLAAEAAVEAFVSEMNRVATTIPLPQTRFVNPHGLTHADHRSSVRDQFHLTLACLQLPEFRALVNTREYRGLVQGPGGYQRQILWTNTNRLLNQAGYAGVKTGTTQAAGACLVSLSQRDDREALAVVFGATSSEARYIDSRNLFRWYWRQILSSP